MWNSKTMDILDFTDKIRDAHLFSCAAYFRVDTKEISPWPFLAWRSMEGHRHL